MPGNESTAREFAFATAADLGGPDLYTAWCAAAGLPAVDGGYGLIMATDVFGRHVTRLTTDVEYLRTLVAGSKSAGLLANMQVPPGVFTLERAGWPDEWAGRSGGRA
ncbi:hypothetical protein [Actinacidiphila sp. bgisy144]|uniref:hypothetical protein n=1 Tax=Actinacidiphila sp. bgisy144 TaxID=3413791 RepID=UPI003EB6E356